MLVKQWAQAALVMVLMAGPAVAGSSSIVPVSGGTINGSVYIDSVNVPGVQVGSTITGSYTYNPSVSDPGPGFTVNPFTSFSLTIGSSTFTLADLNNGGLPLGRIVEQSNSTHDELYFFIDQKTFDTFLGVPTTYVATLGFGSIQSYNVAVPTGLQVFAFQFATTPGVVPVPEPTGLTLAGFGVIGLALRARRRRAA